MMARTEMSGDMAADSPLFRSTHDALIFCFEYAGQQSPRTPMTSLLKGGNIGSGKGLSGLDGAAQAGFILAAVGRLPDVQHNVIVARYHRATHECECCEQPTRSYEWRNAIDALTHCVELEGVNKKVRLMLVERVFNGTKISIDRISKENSLNNRTLYRQLASIKEKYRKQEKLAMAELEQYFIAVNVVGY